MRMARCGEGKREKFNSIIKLPAAAPARVFAKMVVEHCCGFISTVCENKNIHSLREMFID